VFTAYHSGRGREGGLCLSVNFADNFVQDRSEDAKISQPVTFPHTGGNHLPHPPLYQPEVSCGNLVSSRL